MALESQGVELFWSTSTAASTVAGALVGEVLSFSGPALTAGVIDVTNLGSTAKEKLMGLPDSGNISLDVCLNTTDTAQVALRADRASRTKRKFVMKLSDTAVTYVECDGYCTGFSISGAVDDAVKASIAIELTGPTSFTTTL